MSALPEVLHKIIDKIMWRDENERNEVHEQVDALNVETPERAKAGVINKEGTNVTKASSKSGE